MKDQEFPGAQGRGGTRIRSVLLGWVETRSLNKYSLVTGPEDRIS